MISSAREAHPTHMEQYFNSLTFIRANVFVFIAMIITFSGNKFSEAMSQSRITPDSTAHTFKKFSRNSGYNVSGAETCDEQSASADELAPYRPTVVAENETDPAVKKRRCFASQTKLDLVRSGMSRDDVERIMGCPGYLVNERMIDGVPETKYMHESPISLEMMTVIYRGDKFCNRDGFALPQ